MIVFRYALFRYTIFPLTSWNLIQNVLLSTIIPAIGSFPSTSITTSLPITSEMNAVFILTSFFFPFLPFLHIHTLFQYCNPYNWFFFCQLDTSLTIYISFSSMIIKLKIRNKNQSFLRIWNEAFFCLSER